MLKLRMAEGMDLAEYEKLFGEDFVSLHKDKIAELTKLKLIKVEDDHLKATDAGFLVLNRIILEFAM